MECKYAMPCGWCEKRNIKCEAIPAAVFYPPEKMSNYPGHTGIESCDWEWVSSSTLGNHYRCKICGATKVESIASCADKVYLGVKHNA